MKYAQWRLRPLPLAACAAMEADGVSPLCARVLCARGLETAEKASAFLCSDEALLQDPMLLADMDKAVCRITAALAAGERIAVYGDYDVDGITSTCLLSDYLRARGGDVTPYIPDRLEEGYGVSRQAVDTLSAQGITLIITVDCGITADDEAAYAKGLGMDMVITDHHECKAELPDAVAVVDPRRRDCPYPFKSLAGVGVALKLVLALGGPGEHHALLGKYADLAAVGTVADVMQLLDENRAIVRMGLEALAHTQRPGLQALLREAGLEGKPLTSVSIGYSLAPRINASGRMGCADIAAELLLTRDPARADALAQELCALNKERQAIELTIFEECIRLADALPPEARPALILSKEGWHQGVVGIVASRLSEKYSCPTFMICLQDGKGKGSCRSFGGFNLFSALEECGDLLDGFGGHELAAGFTISEGKIPAFREKMSAVVRSRTGGAEMVSVLAVDAELSDPDLLTQENILALDRLEPFGSGNPKPVFSLSGCAITSMSDVGGGRHLKLKVTSHGKSFDAIFFSTTAADSGLMPGDRADLAFYPQINDYRGWRTVQLQVTDLRPALTRAQSERALYEKFRRGESLTSAEAGSLTPSRAEFAGVWRYLKGRGNAQPMEDQPARFIRNIAHATGLRETFLRTMVCLDVFDERGLMVLECTADRLKIALTPVEGKVDLDQSAIMIRLRESTDHS
ncbi:MAG: single-stranded-DNA-specific exonuclease RecJ [Pseudoflavonifractor sp.]